MRVVSTPPKISPWQFTCRSCKAVLEASESDIRLGKVLMSDQQRYYVECPACHTTTIVQTLPGWAAMHPMPVTKRIGPG